MGAVAREALATDPGLRFYEVPTIGRIWAPVRNFIDGGMASAIREPVILQRTLTVYGTSTASHDRWASRTGRRSRSSSSIPTAPCAGRAPAASTRTSPLSSTRHSGRHDGGVPDPPGEHRRHRRCTLGARPALKDARPQSGRASGHGTTAIVSRCPSPTRCPPLTSPRRSAFYQGLLVERREYLNALNVYPVPDADTGANLCSTLGGVVDALARDAGTAHDMPEVSAAIRQGALLGDRGASGVITSQLLGAMCRVFEQHTRLDGSLLASGLAGPRRRPPT